MVLVAAEALLLLVEDAGEKVLAREDARAREVVDERALWERVPVETVLPQPADGGLLVGSLCRVGGLLRIVDGEASPLEGVLHDQRREGVPPHAERSFVERGEADDDARRLHPARAFALCARSLAARTARRPLKEDGRRPPDEARWQELHKERYLTAGLALGLAHARIVGPRMFRTMAASGLCAFQFSAPRDRFDRFSEAHLLPS